LIYAVSTIEIIDNLPEVEEYPSIWVSYIYEDRVEKITDWPYIETAPTWSPDGRWIAFISDHENIDPANDIVGGSTDLYIMPTTCLDKPESCDELSKKVTSFGPSGWVGIPNWSPDSTGIAFIYGSEDNPQTELCVYSIVTEEVSYLTVLTDRFTRMAWSPDSDQIIFTSDDDLFLITFEETSSINLTNSTEWEEEGFVQWSPDGQYIAISSSYPGNDNLGFGVINPEKKERIDYHETISGSEIFLSWLVIPEPIEIGD
jgi:Tol biopolymer transport system component